MAEWNYTSKLRHNGHGEQRENGSGGKAERPLLWLIEVRASFSRFRDMH